MGAFNKVGKVIVPLFIVTVLSVTGVYATWEFADIPPAAPEIDDIVPGLQIFDWIPGMAEDEVGEGSNTYALIQAIKGEDGVADLGTELIDRILARSDHWLYPDKNNFGSMAITGGFSTSEDLVGSEVADNIAWIVTWDNDVAKKDFDDVDEFQIYSYDVALYGSLGTNDQQASNGVGQHYKHMQAAGSDANTQRTANNYLRNNFANNREAGNYFGVIYKTIIQKNPSTGAWDIKSSKPGHARAGYYQENQPSMFTYLTHIPAWAPETWIECTTDCKHPHVVSND